MSYFEDFEEHLLGSLEYSDFEQYILSQEPKKYILTKTQDKWIMRNGQEIDIKDMETTHIINSLNMVLRLCKKKGCKATDYNIYNKLRRELDIRTI